jgi:hypothetical protein
VETADVAAEHLHRVPLLDTLERVMERSIVVDGPVASTPRAPAVMPTEWIDAAGETFVVARAHSEPDRPDSDDLESERRSPRRRSR